MFKTIEEANEWKVEQEKKYAQLETAHQGLQNKLEQTETSLSEKQKEVDSLKIKNYEFLTQLNAQYSNEPGTEDTPKDETVNFDDFLKEF